MGPARRPPAGRSPSAPVGREVRRLSSLSMQEFLSAIRSGASGEELAGLPDPRVVPGRLRPPRRSRDVRRNRIRGQGPEEVAPRGRGGRPRAGSRRGLRGRHGQFHQLQHSVDVDLRAAPHVRLPRPAGQGEPVGGPPRPRLPRGRIGRLRRRLADGLGRAPVEAGRQGHRPLQLRRRPEPECPRRLDAGRQPADLGVRDQLRRSGRSDRGQGQPADAEAHPSDLGGGRRQRPVQLHLLPDAGVEERCGHASGGQGPGVGRIGRSRCLCRPVRPQRRRHPGRGGVVADKVEPPPRPGSRGGDRSSRRPTTGSGRTSTPKTSPSGVAWARTSAPWSATTWTSSSNTRAARPWAPRSSPPSGAASSSPARPPPAT